MRHHDLLLTWLLTGSLLAGLATVTHAGEGATARIEGTVWYRERMALPPGAEVTVRLEDVARADAPAELLAETRFVPEGGPPWAFALDYDPARLDDRGVHVLRARVEVDGRLWFTNTERVPAFDRADGKPLSILVRRAGGERVPAPARTKPPVLTDARWVLVEIDGEPAGVGADGKAADLAFTADGRVSGFGGCNRFNGAVEVAGATLVFGPLMSTMMACADGDAIEQSYLPKLVGTLRFAVSGAELVLYGGDDSRPLLRFRAE